MSISPPRYTTGPLKLRGRSHRTLTILDHEVRARFGAGTMVVVALSYLSIVLVLVLVAEFTPSSSIALSTFYEPYTNPIWPLLILLIATAAGAPSLAADLGNRSITLYLSRPIHVTDYLAAKALGVALWIALVAIGPVVVAAAILAALGVVPAGLALTGAATALGVGLLTVLFFTGLAIALSGLTSKSLSAGVAIFGSTLSLEIAAAAISGATGNPQVRYLSPFTDVRSAAQAAFQTGGSHATDPLSSALLLLGASIVLFALAWLRLRRVEVVGE